MTGSQPTPPAPPALPWHTRLLRRLRRRRWRRVLRQCPELRDLPEEVARKWVAACRREVMATLPPWMKAVRYLWFVYLCAAVGLMVGMQALPAAQPWVRWVQHNSVVVWLPFHAINLTWIIGLNRRARRYRQARLAAELRSGRFRNCIVCDYDLRGTPGDTCPECGASVLVPRGTNSQRVGPGQGVERRA